MIHALLSVVGLAAEPLDTVSPVDLPRYMGTWYEIARLENRFERGCEAVTATYALREDGRVDVLNLCHVGAVSGRERSSHGVGRVPDPSAPGKLEVSFFGPFWGDYQIIALDTDYRWAVVGAPNRKYLWILSRTPRMDARDRDVAVSAARSQGFDVSVLRETLH